MWLLVNGNVSRGRYTDFAREQNLEVIQKIVLTSRFSSRVGLAESLFARENRDFLKTT